MRWMCIRNARCGARAMQKLKRPRVMRGRFCLRNGRADWIRTSDHLHPMQVRYQTAPQPVVFRRRALT